MVHQRSGPIYFPPALRRMLCLRATLFVPCRADLKSQDTWLRPQCSVDCLVISQLCGFPEEEYYQLFS